MSLRLYCSFVLYIFLIALLSDLKKNVNGDEDLTLSKSQKQTLDKFKEKVQPKLYLDFMKNDLYLVRWLRAKNFDVRRATEMLNQHLKWRKDYKLDTIHDEDWLEFEKEYPVFTDGVDNAGRPIYAINFGADWDIRKAAIAGKLPKLLRWLIKGRDLVVNKVYRLQKEGKNITQWNLIVNLEKLTQLTHLCSRCLPLYTEFATTYELHYPSSLNNGMLLSAPQVFDLVMNLVRPLLTPATNVALKVYPLSRAQWEPILFKTIDRNQLPSEFGGTKNDA